MNLLLEYNLSYQPLSIGDVLLTHEMGLCLLRERGLRSMRFAFTYDPSRPVVADRAYGHITTANFHEHVAPIRRVAACLRSVAGESLQTHEQFAAMDKTGLSRWPVDEKRYLHYVILEQIVAHYRKTGSVPAPEIAATDCFKIALPTCYVSVQLRRNPRKTRRNSNYEAWLAFCADHSETQFVLIGGGDEVDERFRLPNVTLSKDSGSDAATDLAIVQGAVAHMGASSGPLAMVQFSRKPYRIIGPVIHEGIFAGYEQQNGRGRFAYSAPNQWYVEQRETPELLNREFHEMMLDTR
jgi:hypothetical protein